VLQGGITLGPEQDELAEDFTALGTLLDFQAFPEYWTTLIPDHRLMMKMLSHQYQ
jgi:hypothetical protein